MLGAKADGCLWYEIGPVYPGLKDGKDRGVTIFKSKFGGELYRSFEGRISVVPDVGVWWHVTLQLLRELFGKRVATIIEDVARFIRHLGHPPRGNA
jgi:hypothetical protein